MSTSATHLPTIATTSLVLVTPSITILMMHLWLRTLSIERVVVISINEFHDEVLGNLLLCFVAENLNGTSQVGATLVAACLVFLRDVDFGVTFVSNSFDSFCSFADYESNHFIGNVKFKDLALV